MYALFVGIRVSKNVSMDRCLEVYLGVCIGLFFTEYFIAINSPSDNDHFTDIDRDDLLLMLFALSFFLDLWIFTLVCMNGFRSQ